MILIDERVGSREFLQKIRGLGVDAELAGKIPADFQFTGNGDGRQVLVGIERKTIQDLLNSMRDRRLAGSQVGGMLQTYDVACLVVEGIWRRQRESGLVEIQNGKWRAARGSYRYSEVRSFLCSLRELGDIRIWRTGDEEETCADIVCEYLWWQKQWHDHRTAKSVYAPPPKPRTGHRAHTFRHETTLLEEWLSRLPHIDSRAIELAQYFSSARDMAEADVDRWTTIKGIGKKTAEQIVEAIRDPNQVG
jgi:ERCC4-type nuclease